MKSLVLLSTALFISCSKLIAQGAFFDAGFGYGLPAGDRIEIEAPSGIGQNVYGSYGKGLAVGIGTGYMVNSNAGLDLGIWYVMGSSYDYQVQDTNGRINDRVSGNTIRIMPSVKVATEKKNSLYAKFGILLGIATSLEGDETFTYPASTGLGTIYSSFKYSEGSSFGWTGAMGIDFGRESSTSIFIELNFCHQNFSPSILTQSVSGLPKTTYKLVDEPNPSARDELLKPVFTFSTIGITAGVKFSSALKKKNTIHE